VADFLGISLGREYMALALLTRAGRGVEVRDLECIPYEEPGAALSARAEFAARRVQAGPHSRARSAISLPGEEVFLQPHVVPFTRRSHIAGTLAFEMEDKLPFDVQSGVLDFTVTAPEGKGSRILVAAIEREKLMAVVEPFTRRGLKVRLVTSDVLAAAGLATLGVEGPYTLLDVGNSAWKLALCDAGRVLFARAAPAAPAAEAVEKSLARWVRQGLMAAPAGLEPSRVILCGPASGCLDCDALADELSLDVERFSLRRGAEPQLSAGIETPAETEKPPAPDEDAIDEPGAVTPGTQEFGARPEETGSDEPSGHARQTPETARWGEEVSETSAEAAPAERAEEEAGEAAAHADAGDRTPARAPAEDACATGALLAAARLAGGSGDINLLKAAMGEEKLSEVLFGPIAAGLVFLALLFALAGLGAWRRAVAARAQEQALRAAEERVWRELFPEREPPGGNVYVGLQAVVRELRESGGREALGADVDWLLRALYVLSKSVPGDASPTFTGFDAKSGQLSIDVVSRETASAHIIAENIAAEGRFTAVAKDLKTGSGGETTYTIVMTPREGSDAP